MLSRQRDTRGLSIIRQLKPALRGRGGGRHMNLKYWIHAACSIIPLPQCKLKKRRSQSLYTEHMFCHRARAWLGYSLAMAVSQYGSTPFDLLPLTNNNHQQQYNCNDHNGTHSPIHSTPHQRRRRRKYRRTWVSLSLSCDLSLSRINTLLHHHALWYCGRDSQTSRLINIMFRRISTWLQWQPICGKEIQ